MRQQRSQAHGTARDRILKDLPVEERRLDVNGVATSVLEGGHGPTMVLLHSGTPAGGASWAPLIPRLTRSHRVVIPDVPGVGESGALDGLDAATFADWLAGLIRLTCQEKPTLVAHSLPGSLAARFAVQHSELIQRLVLMGTPSLGRWRPPPGFLVALIRLNLRPSPRNLDRFMCWAVLDLDRAKEQGGERYAALADYGLSRSVVPSVKRTMRQLGKAGTKQIPDTELKRIAVPTVLLWGRQDRMISLRFAEAASQRLGWPMVVVDDAGHMPNDDRPEAFLDALAVATREQV